jgi:hypothetical protein
MALDNGLYKKKLRDEHKFTLEVLGKENNITLTDCHNFYNYAKILYE